MNKRLPITVDIFEKKTVVIGGNAAAAACAVRLLPYVQELTVITDQASAEMRTIFADPKVHHIDTPYRREWILDADIVFIYSDTIQEMKDIYAACKCLGISVYCEADPGRSDFFLN